MTGPKEGGLYVDGVKVEGTDWTPPVPPPAALPLPDPDEDA